MGQYQYDRLLADLAEQEERFGLQRFELGRASDSLPLFLISPPVEETQGSLPRIMIGAGAHGEEIAGPLAIAEFLKQAPDNLYEGVTLSFLPIINPSGFIRQKRKNSLGENVDRGFCTRSQVAADAGQLSAEGRILVQYMSHFRYLASAGYISLHEDLEAHKFYIYTWERAYSEPGPFSTALRDTELKYFQPMPDGMVMWNAGEANQGIIFNYCDGSLEDELSHLGIPRTATTETPGVSPLHIRVEANVALINTFVNITMEIASFKHLR